MNPSNTEIKEDNYTQPPHQFSVHEEAYLILMVSIAYHFLWPVCFPCLVTHKECRWDRGSKKSLINKRSWLKKAMKLLDWSVLVTVVISSIPNQTSVAGNLFNSKLFFELRFHAAAPPSAPLYQHLNVFSARCFCELSSLKTYLIRLMITYFFSIVLAAGGFEKIILLLNYNQYKKNRRFYNKLQLQLVWIIIIMTMIIINNNNK